MWACSGSCQLGFVFNPLNLARRRDDIMSFFPWNEVSRMGDQGLEGAAENITGKVGQGDQIEQSGERDFKAW